MYRHSIFFRTIDEAEKAKAWIDNYLQDILDIYLSNDGESGNIEVRLFTQVKFTEKEIDYYMKRPSMKQYVTYALNCDDGD